MMSRSILFVVVFLALGGVALQSQTSRPAYRPLRLLHGKRFPSSESSLLRQRDKADKHAEKEMREHAWDLLGGLTRKEPIWETWYSKCDVRLEACPTASSSDVPNVHKILRSLEVPVQSLQVLANLPRT